MINQFCSNRIGKPLNPIVGYRLFVGFKAAMNG